MLEIPRGFREKGETTRQAASRELMEEISGISDHYIYLGTIHPDSGIIDEELAIYLALNVTWDITKL